MTSSTEPKGRLVLIDGSGYIFRAYHGLPPLTRGSDGLPVGAVSGFCNMLFRLIKENRGSDAPTHLAVIFDAGSKTFRNDLYDGYKANRPPAPDDLIPQFPLIRRATEAFGVPAIELSGFEADDLIATYARLAVEAGLSVTIISSDKDLMQLITDQVLMMDPVKSTSVGREQVLEKFGVPPELVVDAQALIGDAADNVPGAPGIGVKTAAQLLLDFGSLEALLERAHEIKQPKRREALIDFRDQILLSQKLVRLSDDVPPPVGLDQLGLRQPNMDVLKGFLTQMEFGSLSRRVGGQAHALSVSSPEPKQTPIDAHDHSGHIKVFDYEAYECVTTEEALRAWIQEAKATGTVAIDTETDALSATGAGLVGISLATSAGRACYIPIAHRAADGLDFNPEAIVQLPLATVVSQLAPLLTDETVLKVGQNIKYDLSVLERVGLDVTPYDDTMLISYVLEGGLHGHGMDELSALHLDHNPLSFKDVTGSGKSAISFDQVGLKQATQYAAEDADITLRLWQLLKPRLIRSGRLSVYEGLERGMARILSAMELEGILVDPEILQRLSHEFGTRMAELEKEAHDEAGQPFNLNSPRQLGEIFFDQRALSGGKRTANGSWATDVKVLEDLAERGEPLAKILLDYRHMAKLKSTYTDNLYKFADKNGRIHTSYSLAATTTGRLSSNEPNLQNIPIRTGEGRKIRKAFIAKKGYKLISADYSQIELRLLAHIGNIESLKSAFARGLDIHALTASEMFQVPLSEMTPEIRRRAKAINFGIIYGISAFGLAAQLGIDNQEASRYIKTYFERFPGIKAYMDATKAYVREHGYVKTLFGRVIHIPEIKGKSGAQRSFAERAAINAPIQGTAADIIRRAMLKMPEALINNSLKTKMLLQVHDELIFEAPEYENEKAIKTIIYVMENAAHPVVQIDVPLNVEAKSAMNWDDAH
jgi:DNA polymerase-1